MTPGAEPEAPKAAERDLAAVAALTREGLRAELRAWEVEFVETLAAHVVERGLALTWRQWVVARGVAERLGVELPA